MVKCNINLDIKVIWKSYISSSRAQGTGTLCDICKEVQMVGDVKGFDSPLCSKDNTL